MSSKLQNLFISSIFIFAFLIMVSAVSSSVFTITELNTPTSVNENAGSFAFTFNLTYTGTSESADISFVDSTTSVGTISIPTQTGMNGTIDESRIVTGTVNGISGHAGETANIVINATEVGTTERDDETTFSVQITSDEPPEVLSCDATGNPGDLEVRRIDFQNNGLQSKTFGSDDEWFPFEEIEVEITVENNGDEDIDDVSIEWGIWDTQNLEWIIDLDEEDEVNINDGDEETLTLTFEIDDDMDVDLEDLDDGDHYRFYVIATGEVDISGTPETCASDFEEASIIIENDFVILNNIEVPETAQCGETITITANAWNIGEDDQDEVSVFVTNTELGLRRDVAAGDIDAFDRQRVSFTFTIPEDAEEKTYSLNFEVHDEDTDVYENDFDEDLSEYTIPLRVEGNCGPGITDTLISAVLESGGRAGEELVIRARITNNGNELRTYTLNAAGFTGWADSVSLDQSTLVLGAGESREVLFTFEVKREVSGNQVFNIEAVSGDDIATQPVSVFIEPGSAGFLTGAFTGGSAFLWGIGILNIILVIIIIIVAVRIARR